LAETTSITVSCRSTLASQGKTDDNAALAVFMLGSPFRVAGGWQWRKDITRG